jgi:hypothetical protein
MITMASMVVRARSTRRLRAWLLRSLVATVVALVGLIGVTGATQAHAQVIQRSGVYGATAPGVVQCRYYNNRGQLSVRAYGPAATAYNRYAGAGNDWQQVRYRVVWYNKFSGNVIRTSGWSGAVWAGDTNATAARWGTGYTFELWRYDDQIAVGYQLAFYNGTTGTLEGVLIDLQTIYQDYQEDQSSGSSRDRCVSSYGNIS